jgi:hypothetical protein
MVDLLESGNLLNPKPSTRVIEDAPPIYRCERAAPRPQ